MPLTCEAPLLGGVEVAAGVSAPVLAADPAGVAAAVGEDSGAFVEDAGAEEAVEAGMELDDEVDARLIPQTASVSNSVGMGLFQATQLGSCLSIASRKPG